MKAIAFSPAAETNIDDIWDYSADNWGPDQADRYTDEIRDACHVLASGRKQGRAVNVRSGYLKTLTGSHVIYFQDQGDHPEIVRVLHRRQDAQLNF
ncbi:plasmid stabilization protein ParE [Sulfitobacter sp. EhC04]|uniref:type II toxin-antitoxin system RelE/ParE family toxin n=1 Tax=Sulfitobacter sp. EhC04 TaxID=1849168 RepID=UPI0007F32D06|nr:type II toxin-antitoxin system RelE/ParE family toxin [Sulfitobacter sp. EhC04]OAN79143.1 plasmid stabilization protein ParE [Sulfitobacter sp. EhC04]